MEDLLEQNLSVIRRRWPAMADRIMQCSPAEVSWDTSTPVVGMEVSGLRMHSVYDPLREAELQLRGIPAHAEEVTLYGVGLGFLQRIALEMLPDARLRIIPMNLGVFRASLEAVDHRDWLEQPRCELVNYSDEPEVYRPFAAVPPCLRLCDGGAARLRDLIVMEQNTALMEREAWISRAERREHVEANLERVRHDGDVAELFGTAKGETLFVAGAGPTLTEQAEWLSEHRGEGRLLAVDAALRPLLNAGIVPDVVVTADAHRENIMRYFGGDISLCSNSALVYLPVVHPDVLSLWPGHCHVAYTDEAMFREIGRKVKKGSLFMSGSVIHCAIDLAVKMGAARVVLFGCDFGFPAGAMHANPDAKLEDAFERQVDGAVWVHDGNGNRIETILNLRSYLRDLERYISRHPEVEMINSSRKGACIEGTRYMDALS